MFNTFLQRVAPFILTSIADSGIVRRPRLRLIETGGPPEPIHMNGSGRTLVRAKEKVGRNEPCSCGSGSKFKHCCGS